MLSQFSSGSRPSGVGLGLRVGVRFWPTARARGHTRNLPLAPEGRKLRPIGCLSAIPRIRPAREWTEDLHTVDDAHVRVDDPVQEAVGDSPLLLFALEDYRLVVKANDATAALPVVAADKTDRITYGYLVST